MLAAILAGVSPAGGNYPVATVAITGDGAGDQTVGSPVVKILAGCVQMRSDPSGGGTNQQVVAKANRSEAPKSTSHVKRICGAIGSAESVLQGRRPSLMAKELSIYSR